MASEYTIAYPYQLHQLHERVDEIAHSSSASIIKDSGALPPSTTVITTPTLSPELPSLLPQTAPATNPPVRTPQQQPLVLDKPKKEKPAGLVGVEKPINIFKPPGAEEQTCFTTQCTPPPSASTSLDINVYSDPDIEVWIEAYVSGSVSWADIAASGEM